MQHGATRISARSSCTVDKAAPALFFVAVTGPEPVNRLVQQGFVWKVKVSAAPRTFSSGRCFPSSNGAGGRETPLPPWSGRRSRGRRTRCAPRLSKILDAGASFRCATQSEASLRPGTRHAFTLTVGMGSPKQNARDARALVLALSFSI